MSQDINFSSKFNSVLNSGKYYNSKINIRSYSKGGNAQNFLLLGYYLNSNDIMFKSTGNISYLKNNEEVINAIKKSGLQVDENVSKKEYKWQAKIKSGQSNYSMNNQEFMLYEGYILRYIAEYYFLLKKNQNKLNLVADVDFLRTNFFKWYDFSLSNYDDDSSLQSLRTHMGSHWATLAMYLYLLDNNEKNKTIYKSVYTRFSNSLAKNLKLVDMQNEKGYVWNSTWDTPFTNYLVDKRKLRKERSEIQDVSHGNHIVQFIIDSYELGLNSWTLKDIQYFSNTLKLKIWNASSLTFSDNVDGSPLIGKYKGSGWKQSDGWMKLMMYDQDLYPIYKRFYLKNARIIDGSSLNLQFYSNFVEFETKYRK